MQHTVHYVSGTIERVPTGQTAAVDLNSANKEIVVLVLRVFHAPPAAPLHG